MFEMVYGFVCYGPSKTQYQDYYEHKDYNRIWFHVYTA